MVENAGLGLIRESVVKGKKVSFPTEQEGALPDSFD